jgi:hypothetical protein
MQVGAIVDCTGIVRDPRAITNPAVLSLFDQGLARVDPLGIGIETSADCAIVSRDGVPSRRLFAVSPAPRSGKSSQSPTSATNVPGSPPNSSASTSKTGSSASPSC